MDALYIDFTQRPKVSKTKGIIFLIIGIFLLLFSIYLLIEGTERILAILFIADGILLIFVALHSRGLKISQIETFFKVDDDGIEYRFAGLYLKKQIKWDLVERIEFRQWKVWFYMKNSKCRKINLDRIQPLTTSVMIKDKIKEYGRLKNIKMSAAEIK